MVTLPPLSTEHLSLEQGEQGGMVTGKVIFYTSFYIPPSILDAYSHKLYSRKESLGVLHAGVAMVYTSASEIEPSNHLGILF